MVVLVSTIPVFPLGSVLLPGMPLALRVFEPRFLTMVGQVLEQENPEFGVVLIERGSEVGGGDVRFDRGTMAEILEINAPEGFIGLLGRGSTRFVVDQWLADDPYPRAEVSLIEEFEVPEEIRPSVDSLEALVRDVLARAHEAGWEQALWPTDTELSADDATRLWQLAGIAPLGPLDAQRLHRTESAEELLEVLSRLVAEAADSLSFGDATGSL